MQSSDLQRIAHEVERMIQVMELSSRMSCRPKLYFEFNSLTDMRAAECTIMNAIKRDIMLFTADAKSAINLDRDAIEISVGGLTIVLRATVRMEGHKHGTDKGYTEIHFFDHGPVSRNIP